MDRTCNSGLMFEGRIRLIRSLRASFERVSMRCTERGRYWYTPAKYPTKFSAVSPATSALVA
jgi:hypothetical protein